MKALVFRHSLAREAASAIGGRVDKRAFVSGFAPAHLDAANDAIAPGRGGNLNAVGVSALQFHRVGKVDRRGVDTDIDRLDGGGAGDAERGCKYEGRERDSGAKK